MEKLADRLSWERTANGIRAVIPARRDWTILFFTIWFAGWTFAGKTAFHHALLGSDQPPIEWFSLIWLFGWAFAEVLVGCVIFWALGGKTVVRLDPAQLQIEWDLFGIRLASRSIATSRIRNLRFSPRIAMSRSSRASEIRFESAGKTLSFASGISDAEALALIDKMLEVYPFPKERALEYFDLSR
jgi:hypothetical protein